MGHILRKRMTVRGFIVSQDFGHLYAAFETAMTGWIATGKMHYCEAMMDGLETAPAAFAAMLRGENFGKTVIRVGPAP
jgi:NADPH-dependent curcumin reductase CurA